MTSETSFSRTLVTGGAGFVGSHLVDRLMLEDCDVTVIDNLSSGDRRNLEKWFDHSRFKLIMADLKNFKKVKGAIRDVETIFHMAANPEVSVGTQNPGIHFEENLLATFNILEAIRQSGVAKQIIFTSTSTVYGEAEEVPTPEDYSPMLPISTYGATKLGCEALICAYCHTFNLRSLILRLANVVGSKSRHGVIYDFVQKLRKNPRSLEILGDGSQKKSYLYIDDCVDAIIHLTKGFLKRSSGTEIYNVGSHDQVTVKEIAEIVIDVMGLKDVDLVYTGGVDGGRGWKGDVKYMQLSIDKLLKTSWKPVHSSAEAVKLAANDLMSEISMKLAK